MFQSQPPLIYVSQRHSLFHGPLTLLLVLWAIALPALLLLLTAFGPIGWLVGGRCGGPARAALARGSRHSVVPAPHRLRDLGPGM